MGKRILITGATGFIGANLVHHFFEKGEVAIFTRKTSNKWRIKDVLPRVSEYSVDLTDKKKLEDVISKLKPEIVFHTATYGGFPFQNNSNKIFETNFIGTFNLVNACVKIGFDVFVNTGSSSEYGIKDNPMKESDLLEPINFYGVAKASATLFCQMIAKKENLPIATLRLFSPYGYYEDPSRLIPSVAASCLRGKNPEVSSPDPVRDFIFVEDVASAYRKVVENSEKISGEIFNIGFGRQHSVGEVVEEIVKLTGNKVKPLWGTVHNPRKEPKMWQADIDKARETLGWVPKWDLKAGLVKSLDWFRRNVEFY